VVRMSGQSALRSEDGYEDGVSLGPEAAQPVRHEGRGDQLAVGRCVGPLALLLGPGGPRPHPSLLPAYPVPRDKLEGVGLGRVLVVLLCLGDYGHLGAEALPVGGHGRALLGAGGGQGHLQASACVTTWWSSTRLLLPPSPWRAAQGVGVGGEGGLLCPGRRGGREPRGLRRVGGRTGRVDW